MLCRQILVLNTRWKLGINIVVMKGSRSTQGSAEKGIQSVGTPEGPTAAFGLNQINTTGSIGRPVSIKTDSQCQVRDRPEQAPAMVDARLREQVITLRETCLHASQTYRALFFGEMMLGC